jgi:hypothetical protein
MSSRYICPNTKTCPKCKKMEKLIESMYKLRVKCSLQDGKLNEVVGNCPEFDPIASEMN